MLRVIMLFVLMTGYVFAEDGLMNVMFNERVPYMSEVKAANTVKGLTADVVNYAFPKAGIKYKWENVPAKRQLEILTVGTDLAVGLGWFKNPDREKFAKFSVAMYQDKPMHAIVKATNKKLTSGKTVESVLKDQNINMLIKDGYSYGQFIDDKIKALNPKMSKVTVESVNMVKMLYADRADYFFITPEEADDVIAQAGYKMEEFNLISFSDMPEGGKRYLMYSKSVDDATIKKIDTYIEEYLKTKVKK